MIKIFVLHGGYVIADCDPPKQGTIVAKFPARIMVLPDGRVSATDFIPFSRTHQVAIDAREISYEVDSAASALYSDFIVQMKAKQAGIVVPEGGPNVK